MRPGLAALMLALTLTAAAQAHEYKLGDLLIDHPWARASIGKAPNGAAYMTITTGSQDADLLVGVASAVAERVELHTHLNENGVMKMRPVEAIEVAPGEPALLEPGGLHVMLIGLKAPLVAGESFPMTLEFQRRGRIEVEVKIEEATRTDAPSGHEHDHGS